MPVSQKDVEHILKLAKLTIPQDQIPPFQKDLEAILAYVEQLKEVDVSGVEPMAHASEIVQRVRVDESSQGVGPRGLHGAAQRDGDQVKVPKVVE